MPKEKLWEECSDEEKAEVEQIELDIYQLKEDYEKRYLNKKQYSQRKRRLMERIERTERKYADEDI